jgi:hypothetical protein
MTGNRYLARFEERDMKTKIFLGILIAVIGSATVGCAEKLTYQRWETIHDGMSSDLVQATLGKPFQTTDQTWVYYDEDKSVTATVYFDKDKVTGKTWQDPAHGMVGKSPNVNQPGESEQINVRKVK